MADEGGGRRSKRARRAAQVTPDATSSTDHVASSTTHRPTPAELQEALEVISMLKGPWREPPILAKRAPAKPNVVACAIAISRGEHFESEAKALELFGVAPDTKVRAVWVEGHLAELAPAGLGTPGEPALPTYLLGRGEPTSPQPPASSSSSSDDSSEASSDEDEDRKEERRMERRMERWASNPAAQDSRWQREQKEARAQRAQEAAVWDEAHGAEREAQHEALTAEQPDFYWALAHEIGRRPKWQLRKGECLEADATRIVAHDEPLLLYRSFRPFRTDGDVMKASQVFSGSPDFGWLDAERARLEQGPVEATRPSLPRCVECRQCECNCLLPDDPRRTDPYGLGGSADCHYLGASDHERLEREEEYERVMRELLAKGRHGPIRLGLNPPPRDATDESDRYELEQERVLEEQGRISSIHGKPWHQVPPGSTFPVHWLDSTHHGGPVERPWELAERERRRREEQEERDRLERMKRRDIPPPRRNEERYGPLANNPDGDERFRKDRAVWYEHATGESLQGLSLAEQWQRTHEFARRFREYNDGRPQPTRAEMPDAPPPPASPDQDAEEAEEERLQAALAAQLRSFAARCSADAIILRHLAACLELTDLWSIDGRREGPHGFEYKVVWSDWECNEWAHVWASREQLPDGCANTLQRIDVLANGGRPPPRPPPIPGAVTAPQKVTQATLLAFERLLSG